MKSLLTSLCILLFLSTSIHAQSKTATWTKIEESEVALNLNASSRSVSPTTFITLRLDVEKFQQIAKMAPKEETLSAGPSEPLEIILPNGRSESFYLTEYTMMEPGLEAKYPEFKTYHGHGVEDPTHRIQLDWTVNGLNAMLMLSEGLAFVKPYARKDTKHYISYFERDMPAEEQPFECGTIDEKHLTRAKESSAARAGDCQLRRYRLAIAATGEYTTQALGASPNGTATDDALVTAHMVSNVNQINGWYERDVTARFILIDNLTDIFYYNGSTDPYTNNSSTTMLTENINNLDAVIGSANFDIGHVIGNSGGTGGVAGLNTLCGASKARGVTRSSASGITRPRFLKVLSHELGHQFGAGHTQNEDCQRSSFSAMEPGAGTTLMSYVTSACANQIQNTPDYYFHAISIQQMSAHMLSTTCATILPSANTAPTVAAGIDRTVPAGTPLRLRAVASDPDGDALTYTWEQLNNTAAEQIPPSPQNVLGPNFRSFPPSPEEVRFLPNFQAVLDGITPTWEVLPEVDRTMRFRVTARDNSTNNIACTDESTMTITSKAGDPFTVITASEPGTSWFEASRQDVNWNVAGTDLAPISCSTVDILLSYDDGLNFSTVLASDVPNIGFAQIQVPTGSTSLARLLIRCSDNIFYNVSETSFEIEVAEGPTFTFGLPVASTSICPGEIVNISVNSDSILGFEDPVTLSVNNLPGATTVSFSDATITPGSGATIEIDNTSSLSPGEYTVEIVATSGTIVRTADYTFTVNPPVGISTLVSPTNETINSNLFPTLSWEPKANALGYEIQVSTSPSFFRPFLRETVTNAASFTFTNALASSSAYHWRVRTLTTCGYTRWTKSQSFYTDECQAKTQNEEVDISPNGTSQVTSSLTINEPLIVSDLSIDLKGTHTYMSDLRFELIGPGGSPTVLLWNELCDSRDDFDISLRDAASTSVSVAPCEPLGQQGAFRPAEPLSIFKGISAAGEWTLRISDNANLDGGTLTSWGLNICSASKKLFPIKLPVMSIASNGGIIWLQWEPAVEENQYEPYEIERRAEGESHFTVVGTKAAGVDKQNNGKYAFFDENAEAGVRYFYRLRQNDLEGNFDYSEVLSATIDKVMERMQVFPNPVHGELSILLDVDATTQTEISLFDLNGRLVLRQIAEGGQFTVDLNEVRSGMYVLKAKHDENEEIVKVVVD